MQKILLLLIAICLLVLLLSCAQTGLWEIANRSNTPDQTAPIPGGSGTITATSTLAESINLTWNKATDDVTMQSQLQYKVFISSNNNIATVTSAESNGIEVTSDWTTDIASFNVTNLAQNNTNYFIVIVMDESSNKAAYTSRSTATTTYPTVSVSNISMNCQVETGFLIGTAGSSTGTVVSVEVQLDGGSYTAATGTTSWKYALPSGASTWKKGSQHIINIRCRDDAGNYSSVISNTVRKAVNKDVNGDGYADVGVGASRASATTNGLAYIYHGGPSGISATADTTITGEGAYNRLGYRVVFGDLNGDGYADFIIGSKYPNESAFWGKAHIFYGGPSGIASANAAAADFILLSETDSWQAFSQSLAIGDANNDGYDDLAVGADDGPSKVYIFSLLSQTLKNSSIAVSLKLYL